MNLNGLKRWSHIARKLTLAIVNKEFLVFCFFLLLSGGFWLSMTLDETYEREFSVPVRMARVPDNVIFSTEVEDTLTFTLSDKGFAMLGYMHGKRLRPLVIDFPLYANRTKGRGTVPVAEVQNLISKMLLSSTRIVSASPDRMDFAFSYGTSKVVPVSLQANVTAAKNRYLWQTLVDPEEVKVFADKRMLAGMTTIPTEEVDVDELKDSVEMLIPLQHASGVKCIPDTVRVVLKADVIVERSVEVPLTVVNAPRDKIVRLVPDKVKVYYNVGGAAADKVRKEQFRVTVNYQEVSEKPSEPCKVHLQSSPSEVSNVRLDDVRVTYLVEQE